jgi:hypothetical protein
MHNVFVEEQVNAFERRQRERQAAMHRMAKSIDAGCPNGWTQVRNIIQGTLAPLTALARFHETSAAREHS